MMGASEDLLEKQSFLRLLCAIGFANRYYGYCLRHPRQLGQTAAMPVSLVTEALEGTRRNFRYDWRENFFAFRAPSPSDDGELGVNVIIDRTRVEWVLVFKTASGHLGSTFAGLAHDAMQLDNPGFQHDPPYPNPRASNKGELAKVLEEGLVLYDDIALAIMKQTWR